MCTAVQQCRYLLLVVSFLFLFIFRLIINRNTFFVYLIFFDIIVVVFFNLLDHKYHHQMQFLCHFSPLILSRLNSADFVGKQSKGFK